MWRITLIVVLMLAAAHVEAQVPDRLSRGEIILRVTPGAITVEPNGACIVQDLGIATLVPEEGTLRWIPEFRPGAGNGFVFTPNEPDDRTALLSQLGSLECVLLAEPNAFLRSDTITENPSDFYFQTDYWPHRPFTDSPTGLRYARDPGPDVVWEDCELVAYLGSNVGTATDAHELPDQWHLRMTQTDLAWLVEQGDSAVKVAIIDSGVDWRHPDLAPNIWQNPGEDLNHDGTIFRAVPTDSFSSWVEDATDINGVDDDENWGTGQWAATDDIIGLRYHSAVWDSLPTLPMWDPNTAQCGSPRDTYYNHHYGKQGSAHGTQMASIICAAHNGFGGVGMCPELSLIPISAGWSMEAEEGSVDENLQHMIGVDELSTVLDYCMAMDVDIINMSLSYLEEQHGESLDLFNTLNDVATLGIIVCNSAGNDNNTDVHIPSKYESVLCCAVVAPDTVKAHQSSFASYVDFCAPSGQKALPGEAEPSEYKGDEFMAAVVWGMPDPWWPWVEMPHTITAEGDTIWAGTTHTYKQLDGDTSGGAAQLSGAFALLKAHYPDHSRDELIAEMVRGAVDVDPYQTNPAWVGKLGDGMINPYRSLTEWGGPRVSELQSGAVWSDSVWVSGDYVVPENASLTIEPGTVVCIANFDNEKTGDYLDMVEICGAVNAVGTAEAPIRFVAYGPAGYGTQELVFGKLGSSEPGAVKLEYCEFIGFSNLLVFGSTPVGADTTTVSHCDFLDPGTGQARFFVLSDAQVRSCTFEPGWTVIPAADALIDWCKFEHVAGEQTVYPPILLGADGDLRVHLRNSILRDAEVAIRTFAESSDTLYLENVLVEHAYEPLGGERGELGIDVQGGVVTATGLTLRGYTVGVSLEGSGRFSAEYSTFTNCYQAALNLSTSDNLMFFGYYQEDPPLSTGGYNVFVGNEKNNIVNLHPTGTISARHNWWGSPSGPPAKSNKGSIDAVFPLLVDPSLPPPPDFIVLAEEPSPPFSVGRNYPNPFNPVTEFTITVPRGGGLVRATVYDIRGRAVRKLLDKALPSGEHRIEFNGRSDAGEALPSGMYLCRFNFRDREEVVKATLVK